MAVQIMNNKFLIKFAISNLSKSSKMVIPFALTAILTIIMFYNGINLAMSDTTGAGILSIIMSLIASLLGIFSIVFLFYTNSFLTKKRKKEFGLYNVLGLEKKHISKIIFIENIVIAVVSITVGLLLGILFSRLMVFSLYKIIKFDLIYQFEVNIFALVATLALFVAIFAIISISNTIVVYRTKTIDMLKADNTGETVPKSSFILTLLGIITISVGYGIALSMEDVISAIGEFFIAVILVAVATFCFFTAISILVLKILKNNKNFYYKPENFIAISGLLYRIKKNAMGLTVITVLSTGIIIMISTTVSMYMGFDEILSYRYSHDIKIDARSESISSALEKEISEDVEIRFTGIKDFKSYHHFNFFLDEDTGVLSFYVKNEDGNASDWSNDDLMGDNVSMIAILSQSGYNAVTGNNISLKDDEILTTGIIEPQLNLLDNVYKNKMQDDELYLKLDQYSIYTKKAVVMNDEEFANFYDRSNTDTITQSFYFNLEKNNNVTHSTLDEFVDKIDESYYSLSYTVKSDNYADFYSIYGTLFFCGIFLSVLFIFAILMIIYYKQIIEGYEDKENFEILKKVGMSEALAKKSINRQVIMVFLLPVITASIHTAVGFKALTLILRMLNLTNVTLFLTVTIATIAIFFMVYILMYLITSRVYVKIVKF